jgi:hypothetical protein
MQKHNWFVLDFADAIGSQPAMETLKCTKCLVEEVIQEHAPHPDTECMGAPINEN